MFCKCVLRLAKYSDKRVSIERIKSYDNRKSSDQLGNKSVFNKIVRSYLFDNRILFSFTPGDNLGRIPDSLSAKSAFDNIRESVESASADEQDIGSVYLNKLLVRMLSSSLRRNIRYRALEYL